MNIKFSLNDFISALMTPRPARDWAVVLLISLLVTAGSVAYAAYLFFGLRTGSILGSVEPASTRASTITKEEITAVAEAYRARADIFERGVSIPGIFDPSK